MDDKLRNYPEIVKTSNLNVFTTEGIKYQIEEKKRLEKEYKAFTAKLFEIMTREGHFTYSDDNVTISIVSDSETVEIDKDKLLEKYPQAYMDCAIVKKKKGSLRITTKKETKE
jgi:hypothetical protein